MSQNAPNVPEHAVTDQAARKAAESLISRKIVESVAAQMSADKDLGDVFRDNEMPLAAWLRHQTARAQADAQAKFIPIPCVRIVESGAEEYEFVDFDLDLTEFTHVPLGNEMLLQNLEDMRDRQRIQGDAIEFEGYNPQKVILGELRQKPEIDYEKCSQLLFKLITQLCNYYSNQYGDNGLRNIAMMYKRDIGGKIYAQMLRHFYCKNDGMQEEVVGVRAYNLSQSYSYREEVGLFDDFSEDIHSVLFTGIQKGVFSLAKFDSREGELALARLLETDPAVLNWLRPHPREFSITYNHGRFYEPDFVVETEEVIYLVEVKGEDKLNNPDVIAKKERGIQYCAVVSRWEQERGGKEWRYLFIPAGQIRASSSFAVLVQRFCEL